MIRSIHVIGSPLSGGAERFYLRLVRGLAERGHAVLAVNRPGSMVEAALGDAVPQAHIAMRNALDIFSRRRIARLIAAYRPHIVQTYMGRATRLTHVPQCSDAVHVARLGGFYKLKAYRRAHAWIGNTRAICEYLREAGFPAERVFYIRNFVECREHSAPAMLAALRERWSIPAGALIVASVGRLIPKKGFDDLLAAFARLPPAIGGRPLHLLVVGGGELEDRLQAYAAQLGIGPRVHWPGWQSDPGPFYELADVFVCPSRHEPLGNVILEAWSHGIAVVSTESHGARELITPDVDGILCAIQDPHAMAAALHELLRQEPAARARLAAAGRRRVTAQYSREAVLDEYLRVYERLRESARHGAPAAPRL